MKGRKKRIYIGAVVLGLLLIVPTLNVLGTESESTKTQVTIVETHATPRHDELQISQIQKAVPVKNEQNNGPLAEDVQVTSASETENNAAIGAVLTGELLLSYTSVIDVTTNNVIWDFSLDQGQTWDGGTYYLIEGAESHPAIDYWGTAKKAVGTMQGDPMSNNGADQHTFRCTDITNPDAYEQAMSTITWGATLPYYDRRIPDIGGYDGNGLDWWYGIIACVGTRDSPGSVDMPIFNYANFVDPDRGWSSYFGEYPDCENAAIEIDQTNGLFYGVFDIYRTTSWDLLLFRGDAHDDGTGHIDYIAESFIGGAENTKYPAVDVHDNKVIILAQSDEGGTQDIVCYYSANAGASWEKTFVADGLSDELYPKIVSFGDNAICTFIMDDDLYTAYTEDGGATWSEPEIVNDVTGSLATDYRNTDVTYDGTVVWTDTRNGNEDIYLDNVPGTPTFPMLELSGFAAAGIGKVSIPVKNIGTKEATNVSVTITVVGGLLGRINKTKTEVIPTIDINEEVTVTTEGMIFGFGKITLTATATCAEATPPVVTKTATGKVLIIFIRNIV